MENSEYLKFQRVILEFGEVFLILREKEMLGLYPIDNFVFKAMRKSDKQVLV